MIRNILPERYGISSRRIAAFLNRLKTEHYNLHSFQINRNNNPVYAMAVAPFTLESPHRLFSAAKAIISLSVLFAIQEGKLHFEDRVIDYFSEYIPLHYSPHLAKMTVYDLLTMQTGMEIDPFIRFLRDDSVDLVKLFFETPVVSAPGSGFRYNNSVPHVLYRLVEYATGTDFETYQRTHVCEPLNTRINAQYDHLGYYNPLTIVMSNEGLLNIGKFYTQLGCWNGNQLLDRNLIQYATSYHVPTKKNQLNWGEDSGYGMQVMRNSYGGFRLPGGFGQFAICLPDDGITVSIMSADEQIDCVLNAFREEIYTSIQKKPLPEDPDGVQLLSRAELSLSFVPIGDSQVRGNKFPFDKTFCFPENPQGLEKFVLSPFDSGLMMTASVHGKVQRSGCGLHGDWFENRQRIFVKPDYSIQQAIFTVDPEICFSSGSWIDDNTFEFVQQSPAEMGYSLCRLSFVDETLKVYWPKPVGMGRVSLDDCLELVSERRKINE